MDATFITKYATEHLGTKPEIEKLMNEMRNDLPIVESILKKYCHLIKPEEPMAFWYAGFGWIMFIKSDPSIFLQVLWSDRRFSINALRRKKSNKKSINRDFINKYNESFYLCEFTSYISLEEKGNKGLDHVLHTFSDLFSMVKYDEIDEGEENGTN